MKDVLKFDADEVMHYLNNNWERAKVDYGALYFFINAYKFLLEKGLYDKSILEKVNFLLSDYWPDYMKFKSSAIQVLAYLDKAKFYNNFYKFIDSRLTPYWKNRYTALFVLQNIRNDDIKDFARLSLNDNHRLVRSKARDICFE